MLAVDAAGEAWALHRLLAAGERGAWTAARVRKDLEGVVEALPTVEELRGRLREGVGLEKVRSPSEVTGGLPVHLVTSQAERKKPVAPAPADDADSYWPTEPDDVTPTRPSPAPIVCRLGAGASVPTASRATTPGVGEVARETAEDVLQTEQVQSAVALPPTFPAGATTMAPPSENRHESGHSASRAPATVRVAAPVPRQARPLAEDKAPRMAASASADQPSSNAALRNRPAPARDRHAPPAGRSGDHTGFRSRSLARVPAQDHGSARPPASHSAQHQPIRPPASGRSEWGDQRRPSVPPPSSVPTLDEACRREAHDAKTAARRIRDLTARGSRPPAPADEAPSPVELALADRLGSYVGALLHWWKARNVDTSRVKDAQERLSRAWQDLVAAARLLLRRNGGSGTTEEACGALTQALMRSHPEARTAHDRWLDRAYQPAAVPAPEADPAPRASNLFRRVATSLVPRQSEPPDRTPLGE
ncbi:hypothetical protein [Azospirillum brasilense]|uniref:hypothetical protein n=1 Tax=Azospirillum brasilense TaxID=192 RepID=UPI0013B3FB66|nr:hypothetical protein [Azospirillum brasilense]